MKIMIVGAIPEKTASGPKRPAKRGAENKSAFEQVCRSIGKQLANRKHEVIVGSDEEGTADLYVIKGMADGVGGSIKPRVWVYRPDDGKDYPFINGELSAKIDFVPRRMTDAYWDSGRVEQVLASDALIAVGGNWGTSNACQLAIALGRTVIGIPCCGGAAEKFWKSLRPYYDSLGRRFERLSEIENPWTDKSLELASCVIDACEEAVSRRVFVTDKYAVAPQQVALFASELSSLLLWIILFSSGNLFPGSVFCMSILSSVLGTCLRNSLRLVFDPTSRLTWMQLFNDLCAGIVLGFGLTLLYFFGAFTVTRSGSVEPQEVSDFQRVSLVLTLAGLTGGLLVEQVAEFLRGNLLGRLSVKSEAK